MKNILVPIDGSKYSQMAIDTAKEMAAAFGSKITLLYVNETDTFEYPVSPYRFSSELVNSIKKETDSIAARIMKDGESRLSDFSGEHDVVKLEGNAASKIIDYVNHNDFDLVVIGSSGMNGIRGAFGSVARKVTLAIHIPTLIVR